MAAVTGTRRVSEGFPRLRFGLLDADKVNRTSQFRHSKAVETAAGRHYNTSIYWSTYECDVSDDVEVSFYRDAVRRIAWIGCRR
jgi:hypothetical protein